MGSADPPIRSLSNGLPVDGVVDRLAHARVRQGPVGRGKARRVHG